MKQKMFFWNSLAFCIIQWMLAIWSLVSLPFLNPACSSGSSRFTSCWSLTWWILSITLLLVSHFSCVRLCATPEMAAHQAPLSLGFSRQEHWSGLPFPSPMHESEKWKWSRSVVSDPQRPYGLQPTRLLRPWDFPARVLEWGVIAFSDYLASKWNKCNCTVVWTFFVIALLWYLNENWLKVSSPLDS